MEEKGTEDEKRGKEGLKIIQMTGNLVWSVEIRSITYGGTRI